MDGRFQSFGIILCCMFHTVILRSIDQVIQEVETNFEKNNDGPVSKFPSRVWYDYELQGRTEELVKLQLDMIVTKRTWNAIMDTDNALPTRNKRNAIKESVRLWPRKIPYHFDDRFNISEKYELLRAMDHWEEHTCLEFIESSNSDSDVIEFKPIDYGCESVVGRMQGRQPINLAKACMYVEVIVHEIGHALGLYHEHMRADRDKYVTINYQNINESMHPQFDKLMVNQYNDYQKPYDYESIMHYGKLFFSVNRSAELLTMVPTDEAYLDIIGEARGLSYNDVRIANELYNCSAGCIEKPCPGGGFLGKNCNCYCKGADSYEVVLCQRKEPCGMPGINLTAYNVSTPNNELISSATNYTYADGSHLIVEHRKRSCGYQITNFTCKNGKWEGELPACEKECTVEDLGDDYSQKYNGYIVKPGYKIPSIDGVYVMCSNMINYDDAREDYISCSDGDWATRIPNIVCVKEHPYCPMIINSTINGSFDTGFKITCLEGFKLEPRGGAIGSQEGVIYSQDVDIDSLGGAVNSQEGAVDSQEWVIDSQDVAIGILDGVVDSQEGAVDSQEWVIDSQEGAVDSFSCTWNGVWKPYIPVCNPASCKVPEDTVGDMYNMSGEVILGGSEVIHGQHINYFCPRGHVPDLTNLACKYGKFDTPGAEFPACRLVTCPDPDVQVTTYSPKQAEYLYGDEVRVHRCKGTLEFVGERMLTCLNDGTWSSTAICRPFCQNRKVMFRPIKDMEFVDSVWHKQVGLASYKACRVKCRNTTRFLCRSFVYGIEGTRRYCRLYRLSADEYPKLTQERSFWTTAVRTCQLP